MTQFRVARDSGDGRYLMATDAFETTSISITSDESVKNLVSALLEDEETRDFIVHPLEVLEVGKLLRLQASQVVQVPPHPAEAALEASVAVVQALVALLSSPHYEGTVLRS